MQPPSASGASRAARVTPLWGPTARDSAGTLVQARRTVRRQIRRLGYDVHRYNGEPATFESRRTAIMRAHAVDLVLDVGANVGQYGGELRRSGYLGHIVSFEPLTSAFGKLSARVAADAAWDCVHVALGEIAGETVIHVAGNSYSSSLLPMTDLHRRIAPESAYVADETVAMETLDFAAAPFLDGERRSLLKLDVQGYELAVLRGASETLKSVVVVEVEMSTRALYEGQPLWHEVVQFLAAAGFQLAVAHELIVDPDSGELLQLDGLFTLPSQAPPRPRGDEA